MKKKISVVVPIYKVEKYINKCIDSILQQTYSNFELILVDDGSPDCCGQICDDYAKKDIRIISLHKKNGGLSDARNYGMKYVTGDYITFIDSDDFIENDYLEILMNMIQNGSEIGILLPMPFYEGKEPIISKESLCDVEEYSSETAIETLLYQKKFDTSAWGKIYKKELWDNIEFPVGKIYEDISTIYKVFLKAKKISFAPLKKYYYLQRKTSIMGQSFSQRDLDYVTQALSMLEGIKKTKNDLLIKAAVCRYINANFSVLMKIKKNKKYKSERNEILLNIKKYGINTFFNRKSRFKTKVALILLFFNIL